MRLSRLEIHNYKSLRHVVIEPGPLSVFVGPNAAGKTNLTDAIDFLGDVYRWGLEQAVGLKGGYENICYRHAKRSKIPIRFRVILEDSYPERFDHTFEFRTKALGIEAPFFVSFENLLLSIVSSSIRFERQEHGVKLTADPEANNARFFYPDDLRYTSVEKLMEENRKRLSAVRLGPLDLIPPVVQNLDFNRPSFSILKSLRVFQLSPRGCREPGVPTPNPDLGRFGGNLPAVVAHLKKHHENDYLSLLAALKDVMPSIEEIETGFTHTKTLGLFLKERGFARRWPAEDISDGTIQAIALLSAIFDPRTQFLVVEEPENSIHPWALRNFMAAVRIASAKKQIFLTTHSPILIDQVKPEELWVIQRPEAETKIDPVLKLDPSLKESWGKGKFTLSEYLDSGVVPEAVPAVHV